MFKKIILTFISLNIVIILIILSLNLYQNKIDKNKTNPLATEDNTTPKDTEIKPGEKDATKTTPKKPTTKQTFYKYVKLEPGEPPAYDFNKNGIDSDKDYLTDKEEIEIYKSDPYKYDTDNDGLPDNEEAGRETSLILADTDSDGLTDKEEIYTHGTDPKNPDTDKDGYTDGEEIKNGYNPLK